MQNDMTTLAALQKVIPQGKSETLELEHSTAELRRSGETICAFLDRRQVTVLEAAPSRKFAPFVFESKPYKRVGSTTTGMTQEESARLVLDRNHSRHRWENQSAVGMRVEDIDREEVLLTRATAIEQQRLSAGTSMDVDACRAYGIAEPTYTETSGAVIVTFKAEVVADLGRAPSQVGPKCGPNPSARNRERPARPPGTDGALWREEPDAAPRPSPPRPCSKPDCSR